MEQSVRFEYTEVLATEQSINAHCEDGFYVKTVLSADEGKPTSHVLMEKRVT